MCAVGRVGVDTPFRSRPSPMILGGFCLCAISWGGDQHIGCCVARLKIPLVTRSRQVCRLHTDHLRHASVF